MKDNTKPGENWEFDQSVTDCFDDMLERSIPQYEVMRSTVSDIACEFIKDYSLVVDVGCSRGNAMKAIQDRTTSRGVVYRGLECSQPMINIARKLFEGKRNTQIIDHNIKNGIPRFDNSMQTVVLSVLTIQFTPIEYRQDIIQSIYDSLAPGGAFIFVEKILGQSSIINKMMVDQYLQHKKANGYSDRQILDKKLSLEGVLVPVTAKWNEELLKMSGFKHIDCFWRWMNFCGWVAIK